MPVAKVSGQGERTLTDLTGDDIRTAREAAGWSITEACRELKHRSTRPLPAHDSLVRSWKRWEAGTEPSRPYRRLLGDLFARPSSPGDGPTPPQASTLTVWRRWLAFELRRLREERGMSPRDVDRACNWTHRLARIEDAQQTVTGDDLGKLLPLYDVPAERQAAYHEAAGNSRGLGWWQRYEHRDVQPWASLYIGLEQGASRLRVYEPQIVHGLLQTPEYAAAVMRRDPVPRAEEQVARLVGLRIARQAALARDPSPLELWVVLDETALRRVVGGAEVMAGQLVRIVEVAERPNVTVQVLPFAAGAHGSTFGAFHILGFSWAADAGVVHSEYRGGGVYLEAQHEVEEHSLTFQQLCALALSPDESVRIVRDAAQEYAREHNA